MNEEKVIEKVGLLGQEEENHFDDGQGWTFFVRFWNITVLKVFYPCRNKVSQSETETSATTGTKYETATKS